MRVINKHIILLVARFEGFVEIRLVDTYINPEARYFTVKVLQSSDYHLDMEHTS